MGQQLAEQYLQPQSSSMDFNEEQMFYDEAFNMDPAFMRNKRVHQLRKLK